MVNKVQRKRKIYENANQYGTPAVAQWVKNPSSIHENAGPIPGLNQGEKDLVWLWLWLRQEAISTPSLETSIYGKKKKKLLK